MAESEGVFLCLSPKRVWQVQVQRGANRVTEKDHVHLFIGAAQFTLKLFVRTPLETNTVI